VLPRARAVSGTSGRAFFRNAAWGESAAGALGTLKKKASVVKLTPMRNGLVILNGVVFIIGYLSALKFGSEKEIGRFGA
jgi:hypothetical protein